MASIRKGSACGLLAGALAAGLLAAGCGTGAAGTPGSAGSSAGTAASTSASAGTATTLRPRPQTAAERRWARAATRYAARYRRWYQQQGGAITDASLSRQIVLFGGCRAALRAAGPSGRYRDVRVEMQRACAVLRHGLRSLRVALDASQNGVVVDGSGDLRRFERALDASLGAAGNAYNRLARLDDLIAADRAQMS